MAGFKTHITTSSLLGVGYAGLGIYHGLPIEATMVAGGLCGIGGMLPDIDSDSGVPLRETMSVASSVTPILLIDRFQQLGLNYEQMVLAGAGAYLFIRFGLARIFMRYTVHRGMFHSIPALLLFVGLAFLLCGSSDLNLRYFKSCGVGIGVFSHLLLDEIYAVEWTGGRWRFKKSFGTALKLWGDSRWGNFSVYSKLAVVVVMILGEPAVMQRYGRLSPIALDSQSIRQRLGLSPDEPLPPAYAAAGYPEQAPGWPTANPWYAGDPNAPAVVAPDQPSRDRTIYDTARRIWGRLRH